MSEDEQDQSSDESSIVETSAVRRQARKWERYRTAGLVAAQLVIIGILFFQVNYLSCRRHTTWDLTQNRRFTLSETSGNYLKSLGGKVRIVMAFLGTSDLYPEVKGLLSEYDRIGGDAVTSEYLDLSRSRSRLAELKDKYQLRFGGDQIVILGETGRIKVIAAEELVTRDAGTGRVVEFKGEEILTSALLEVTEQQQRKVYLVAGGRRADELVPIAQQIQPLANAQNARLESIVLEGRQDIPEDADALFFPGNTSDLSERELDLVREYWEGQKGGLVFFLDPSAETPNIDGLLRENGVAPNRDRVLSVISLAGLKPKRISDVPVALMPGGGPTRDLPALTARLNGQTESFNVLFEDDLLLSENIRPRPLMVAGEGFWGETEFQSGEISFNPDLDTGPPDLVFTAASVERGVLGDPELSQGSSRLVVVGNPNLIAPDGNTSKVAADFTMASLNWVMNREELMGISPRRPTSFTLNISPADFGLLQSLTIFLIPGIALIIGGLVWLKRRA
ncbi:MAG: Gldg family protein [Verrucomicrobiales bacterium]|nr:Gldg family protein [Verrucomicrobiales bacterium]